MSTPIYIVTITVIFGTIVSIFAMKYFASARQSASRVANEDAYRTLAATAASVQAEVRAELAQICARLAAVEKILKDVG